MIRRQNEKKTVNQKENSSELWNIKYNPCNKYQTNLTNEIRHFLLQDFIQTRQSSNAAYILGLLLVQI